MKEDKKEDTLSTDVQTYFGELLEYYGRLTSLGHPEACRDAIVPLCLVVRLLVSGGVGLTNAGFSGVYSLSLEETTRRVRFLDRAAGGKVRSLELSNPWRDSRTASCGPS